MRNQLLILLMSSWMWPHFSFAPFKILSPSLSTFDNLTHIVTVWISFSLSCLEFVELLGCVDSCFSYNFGSFWPLFLQIVTVHLFLLSHRLLLCIYWYNPCGPIGIWGYVHFLLSFFFLLLRLANFKRPVFKFIDSFTCLNWLLNTSSESLISVIILLKSRIFMLKIYLFNWYSLFDETLSSCIPLFHYK